MLSQIRDSVQRYVRGGGSPTASNAYALLQESFGAGAEFRPGQLEAITAIADDRARLLVVQRTGWGKSLVYFLATRLLRDRGAGPTLLVSPLLSLIRNQLDMAKRMGIRAACLTSENRDQWHDIERGIAQNEIDLLMISPERLASQDFKERVLPSMRNGIGLLVIDEAHCISDWGHDFRPDFRRIRQVADGMPAKTPVLATTATANTRVIADIQEQLGKAMRTQRGPLMRASLRLQVIELPAPSMRLAWLATYLPTLPGSGIVYCLTKRDTELLSSFLQRHGIDAPAYHSDLDPAVRVQRENQLIRSEVKALCATVALGMGFDKPDLGFVVHYQRPGSLVAYYQQVGRAGRATDEAVAILLAGEEDDHIELHFIDSAFPDAKAIAQVLRALDAPGMTRDELAQRVNLSQASLEHCLKFLDVEGAVRRDGTFYERTRNGWLPEVERWRRVTAQRDAELKRMREFVQTRKCLMRFAIHELDDPARKKCGRCANCTGDFVSRDVSQELVDEAQHFLNSQWIRIERRSLLPSGILPGRPRQIPTDRLNEVGLALCEYNRSGFGKLISSGKYAEGRFDDTLVLAATEAIRASWPVDTSWWIVPVPSLRHPELVLDFSRRLGDALGIKVVEVLSKTRNTAEQKSMESSSRQCANVIDAFRAEPEHVRPGPVLLIDDIVDSGWTLTVCGAALRRSGSGPVHPFSLAAQRKANEARV